MAEYKLSFTAKEIDDKLGKVSQLSENVGSLQTDVGGLQTDIQDKAEIMMLTSAEYEALDQIDGKTLYLFTDGEETIEVPTKVSELENDAGYLTSVPEEYVTETELTAKGYLTEHQSLEGLATETYVDNATTTLKNELLNGAGEAYDTLKELGDLIDDNTDALDALETVASGKQDKITGTAGDFVVIGSDGNVTTKTIAYAEGVSF